MLPKDSQTNNASAIYITETVSNKIPNARLSSGLFNDLKIVKVTQGFHCVSRYLCKLHIYIINLNTIGFQKC